MRSLLRFRLGNETRNRMRCSLMKNSTIPPAWQNPGSGERVRMGRCAA